MLTQLHLIPRHTRLERDGGEKKHITHHFYALQNTGKLWKKLYGMITGKNTRVLPLIPYFPTEGN